MSLFPYVCSFQSTAPGRNNNFWETEHPNLRCLDAHLKTVLVHSDTGIDCDVDFLNFFILNARVLRSMTIVVQPNNKEFLAEQREKLQLHNRASRGAQFRFTTEDIRRKYWDIWNARDLYLVDP